MKSELVIDVQPKEISIALLEDSRLVSLQKEARNIAYAVGDIYFAKVKKLMPGLNAAFVNVGYEKDAFLHYLDLGSHFASYDKFMSQVVEDTKKIPALSKMKLLPDIDKHGSITDQLQQGKQLMVQIVKEPISSKGPRLTTELSFTGRYMVLMPFSDKVSVSQKIKSTEEKLRLRQLITSIKPKNFGVIIRTSAEGKRVAELNNELKTLVKCWEDSLAKAQKLPPPALIFEEESRIVSMLRDVFSPSFEAIYVNDAEVFEQIQNYVSLIAPDRKDIVKLHSKPEPIFDVHSITRQIKSSFGKTVSFKSGAYIIIEHTEALHVIDVNSGNRTKATNDQETNALEVNLRAADEIARQLRLRDMGGIIVIDFIDMAKNEHRQELYEHMKEIMSGDRARHNILPLSKFGLMQITRQRVRPALDITTTETCPSCFGRGEIQPSLLFTDTLREKLEYVINELNVKKFNLYVHPYVEAYLKKGWMTSLSFKWRRSLDAKFKIYADQSLSYLEYRVIDADGNILDLREEKDVDSSSSEKKRHKTDTHTAEPVASVVSRGPAKTMTLLPEAKNDVDSKSDKDADTGDKTVTKSDLKSETKQLMDAGLPKALPAPKTQEDVKDSVADQANNEDKDNIRTDAEAPKPSKSARRRARAKAAKIARARAEAAEIAEIQRQNELSEQGFVIDDNEPMPLSSSEITANPEDSLYEKTTPAVNDVHTELQTDNGDEPLKITDVVEDVKDDIVPPEGETVIDKVDNEAVNEEDLPKPRAKRKPRSKKKPQSNPDQLTLELQVSETTTPELANQNDNKVQSPKEETLKKAPKRANLRVIPTTQDQEEE